MKSLAAAAATLPVAFAMWNSGAHTIGARSTAPSSPSAPIAPVAPVAPSSPEPPLHERSLREWAACDGVTDDAGAVGRAFAAAANDAFTLRIDCAARLRIGSHGERAIAVRDRTTVVFSAGGELFVDDSSVPAFVFAGVSHVNLAGWNLEWDGTDASTAAGAHPGILAFVGDTSAVAITGLQLHAPKAASVDRLIPVAISFAASDTSATPHDLTFSDVTVDGAYTGFSGTVRDTVFSRVRSRRYGAGGNLFAVSGTNLQLADVIDEGLRVGTTRGSSASLAIGGDNVTVSGYTTARAEGFLDLRAFAPDGRPYENVVFSHIRSAGITPASSNPHVLFADVRRGASTKKVTHR